MGYLFLRGLRRAGGGGGGNGAATGCDGRDGRKRRHKSGPPARCHGVVRHERSTDAVDDALQSSDAVAQDLVAQRVSLFVGKHAGFEIGHAFGKRGNLVVGILLRLEQGNFVVLLGQLVNRARGRVAVARVRPAVPTPLLA